MKLMARTGLKQIRENVGISQEGLARRTRGLSSRTVRNAEEGRRVTFDTATQLLAAVNNVLTEIGRPTITLDDLGLTLY
jgi:DNA-binding transcriptional regulator YiaG